MHILAAATMLIAKPDESMNPYESTMNPIQKTYESMNPWLFTKRRRILLYSSDIMDSWIHRFSESDSSWIHTDSWIHLVL